MLGASGGGGNEHTANSQVLSDLQSENRELRRKLETLEEKEKARKITSGACAGVDKEVQTKEEGENVEMADTSSAADQEPLRPGLMDKIKQLFRR